MKPPRQYEAQPAHNITCYPRRFDSPELAVAEQRMFDGEPIQREFPAQYVVHVYIQGRNRYIGVRNSLLEAQRLYDRALFYLWGRMERPRESNFFRKPAGAPELSPQEVADLWRVRSVLNDELKQAYFSRHGSAPPAEVMEFTTYGQQPASSYFPDTLPPRSKQPSVKQSLLQREKEKILRDAGYTRPVSLWRAPDGKKFINVTQALAYLESQTQKDATAKKD